jgi:protein-disulfide isomerase
MIRWLAVATFACGAPPNAAAPKGARAVEPPRASRPDQLSGAKQELWKTHAPKLEVLCRGLQVSLEKCASERPSCVVCGPAVALFVDGIDRGYEALQLVEAHRQRFGEEIAEIPLDGVPRRGPEDAIVTIVEFVDFDSSDFRAVMPELDAELASGAANVQLVSRLAPARTRLRSELAARASIAAGSQGKYWEMRALLGSSNEEVEPEAHAKRLGLDGERFRADMRSQETDQRLVRDVAIAHDLGVFGAPTLFINGRRFNAYQDLGAWIGLEIAIVREQDAPPPSSVNVPNG